MLTPPPLIFDKSNDRKSSTPAAPSASASCQPTPFIPFIPSTPFTPSSAFGGLTPSSSFKSLLSPFRNASAFPLSTPHNQPPALSRSSSFYNPSPTSGSPPPASSFPCSSFPQPHSFNPPFQQSQHSQQPPFIPQPPKHPKQNHPPTLAHPVPSKMAPFDMSMPPLDEREVSHGSGGFGGSGHGGGAGFGGGGGFGGFGNASGAGRGFEQGQPRCTRTSNPNPLGKKSNRGGGGFFDAFPGAAVGGGAAPISAGGVGAGAGPSGWPAPPSAPAPFPGFGRPSAPGYPPFGGPFSAYPAFGGGLPPGYLAFGPSGGMGGQGGAVQPSGYPGASGPNSATPALTFGATTSYGPPTTPGGCTPWSAPVGAVGDPWGNASGAGGGFYAPPQPAHEKKPRAKENSRSKSRKRFSSMKRAVSEGPVRNREGHVHEKEKMGRSNSFGGGALGVGPFGMGGYPPFSAAGAGAGGGYPPFTDPAQAAWFNANPNNPGVPPPQYAMGDVYGPNNLARRPRDWRADYVPLKRVVGGPGGLGVASGGMGGMGGGALGGLVGWGGKGRSDVQEISDNMKRKLHPLLEYKQDSPPMEHDLRTNPLTRQDLFNNIARPHNNIDLAQLACYPPATFMRLYHVGLPWYIDVRASRANGVMVYDVMSQMYRVLMKGITPRHWWNEEVGDELRKAITESYAKRVREAEARGDRSERGRGVVWLDWLGDRVIFEGLVRGRNGMWEMKTERIEEEGVGF